MTSPIEAMEHDMLLRIRDALHPFTFCVYPGEVYIRRNLILAQLVRHKDWVSSQDKLEVIALIFQYWSHGSHPPRGAMQPIVPITTQPDVVETVEQDVDPRKTEAMLAIFEELVHRVPEVSESECEEDDGDMCHSCRQSPMCEWTPPECFACYREHCD